MHLWSRLVLIKVVGDQVSLTSFRMQLPEAEVRPHQKITGIKSFQQFQRIVIVYPLNRSIFL